MEDFEVKESLGLANKQHFLTKQSRFGGKCLEMDECKIKNFNIPYLNPKFSEIFGLLK